MYWRILLLNCCLSGICVFSVASSVEASDPLKLHLRTRTEVASGVKRWHTITSVAEWNPLQTAIVVSERRDTIACSHSTARFNELASRIDEVCDVARGRGIRIIHCNDGLLDVDLKAFQTNQRSSTDHRRDLSVTEPERIFDSKDGYPLLSIIPEGGRDIHKCHPISTVRETIQLLNSCEITNVIVMGRYLDTGLLTRPNLIQTLVSQKMNVVLMRDLIDTFYIPAIKPSVSQFVINDLMIEHFEKYWSPTITSCDFLGGKPFRFREDNRSHLVVLSAENEYKTELTLPEFAKKFLGHDFITSFVFEAPEAAENQHNMPGIDVVKEADLLLISTRRKILPTEQLDVVKNYVAAGKPVVGIRTANHAFALKTPKTSDGFADWPYIDCEVFGGSYHGFTKPGRKTWIRPLVGVAHPILTGISQDGFQSSGTLYFTDPLDPDATELMRGHAPGIDESQPAAWIFRRPNGGKTFYTSAGHPDDFQQKAFQRMLLNAIYWAVDREIPAPDFQFRGREQNAVRLTP